MRFKIDENLLVEAAQVVCGNDGGAHFAAVSWVLLDV